MDLQRIYFYIEEGYNIHLGLGDKMLVSHFLREHNPVTVGDTSHLILRTLINFNYTNRELKKKQEDHEKGLKRFAEYVFQRYKTK